MKKTAVVIVNLGTPDKPGRKEVRRYLSALLNDPRVMDIPWLLRKILVNLFIIPLRVKKSTASYKRLWTEKGSPIIFHLHSLSGKLQRKLGEGYRVYPAMRYGSPSLPEALRQIKNSTIEKIVLFPLFPQYASSTTGSVLEKFFKEIKSWQVIPAIRIIQQYYSHPAFIKSFTTLINEYITEDFDHIVFSYHGLPLRHINRVHPGIRGDKCTCHEEMPAHGSFCYKAACYDTTRLLAGELGIPGDRYSTAFQSRLTKDWITPFTDELITELAKKGARKILVTAPSFVADCLETILEIEQDYKDIFKYHGGSELVMVRSLNDSSIWVEAIAEMVS